MTGEINFGALDPASAFTGAAHTNALLQQFAKIRAGKALAGGDTQGAMDTLNASGDLAGAQQVMANHWTNAENVQKLSTAEHARSAQFAQDVSSALWGHLQQHSTDPDGGKAAVLDGYDKLRPLFRQMGGTDADLDKFRGTLANDPATVLTYMHQQATDHLGKHVVGDALVNDHGDVQYQGAPKVEYKAVKRPDQGEDIVRVGGGPAPVVGGQAAAPGPIVAAVPPAATGTPTEPQPAPVAAAPAPLDAQQFFNDFVHKAEGGINPHDLNGAVTNMGFNQAANPDIDVTKLTPEAAAERFKAKYFDPSGAGNLPPGLGAVHADTYFINPHKATEILQQAGGDPAKYMQLRSAWLQHVAQTNPDAAKYGPVWAKRDRDLAAYAQQAGGAVAPPSAPAAKAPVNPNVVYSSPSEGPLWETLTAKEGDPNFRPGTTYKHNKVTGDVAKLQDPLTPTQVAGAKLPAPSTSDMASVRELRKQVNEVTAMADKLGRFVDLNQSVKTGGTMAMPGLGTALGAFNPKIAEMNSIVNNITPAMRNGLPGAASDKDVAMFRGATVGLDKPLAANQAIASASRAFAKRQGDYLSFLEAHIKNTGSSLGADELWQKYATENPLFSRASDGVIKVNTIKPWREAIPLPAARTAPGPASTTGRSRKYNLQTGAFE